MNAGGGEKGGGDRTVARVAETAAVSASQQFFEFMGP